MTYIYIIKLKNLIKKNSLHKITLKDSTQSYTCTVECFRNLKSQRLSR